MGTSLLEKETLYTSFTVTTYFANRLEQLNYQSEVSHVKYGQFQVDVTEMTHAILSTLPTGGALLTLLTCPLKQTWHDRYIILIMAAEAKQSRISP